MPKGFERSVLVAMVALLGLGLGATATPASALSAAPSPDLESTAHQVAASGVSTVQPGAALLPEWTVKFSAEATSCTVSIACQYSPSVSCTSPDNQCTTSAGTPPDGPCVVCDGVQEGCCEVCTPSCTSACDTRWEICIIGCNGQSWCENNCWTNRDICYHNGCGCN